MEPRDAPGAQKTLGRPVRPAQTLCDMAVAPVDAVRGGCLAADERRWQPVLFDRGTHGGRAVVRDVLVAAADVARPCRGAAHRGDGGRGFAPRSAGHPVSLLLYRDGRRREALRG